MPQIAPVDLVLTPEQEEKLTRQIREELDAAIEVHRLREQRYADYLRAYKARPEHAQKDFPWKGASNLVIPIVGITVDNIVARLMRSFFGMPVPIECEIKEPQAEDFEKDFRDWAQMFLDKSGARDVLRSCFHDMALDGTVFVKTIWDSKTRTVHAYGADGGEVTATDVVDYEGPMWSVIPACDLIYPDGYEEWSRLPWIAHRIRFSWSELVDLKDKGYKNIDDDLRNRKSADEDAVNRARRETSGLGGISKPSTYEMYEVWGKFEVPVAGQTGEEDEADEALMFQEIIVTYSYEDNRLHRAIYNPFFGRARHIVRIPFLHQPHEIVGMGAAEQVLQFQQEASTAHNQTIDAATAAIAGIVVTKPSANVKSGMEVYPGKVLELDDPQNDINVIHLSMGNSSLPNAEQAAAFWAEKRSGVNSYSMGVESQVAGSRATATGTTALISEGNQRFWVSIDDMRNAIVDLLYLTLQMIQQYSPEGAQISQSRILQVPQGDIRTMFGFRLQVSSEKVNKDLEIQSFQMLIQILNEYYSRVMQAAAIIMNPAFPPGQKLIIIQVMHSSMLLTKRLVERFEIENIDELVPGLDQALQMIGGLLGPAAMAQPSGGGPAALPPGPAGGPAPGIQ